MSFDINNFVIDRVIRGTMLSTADDSVLWAINQIEDPQITVNADSVDAVDAIGVPIMTFERAKNAEFSASNSLIDLGLLAAQSGSAKRLAAAGSGNTILVPHFQEFTWVNGADVTLDYVPVGTAGAEVAYIYDLNGDGSLGKKYTADAAAGEDKFKVVANTKKITPPTNITTAKKAWCVYYYTADGTADLGAVLVANDAKNFPTAGKFIMEVLGADTCNITTKYYAYIVFPQAKLMSDFDLTFSTDGKHPFTIKAMQEYCSDDKTLFSIYVPEA